MKFKSEAQACFNRLPPSRRAQDPMWSQKSSPDDHKRNDARRQIEIKREQMALARELERLSFPS